MKSKKNGKKATGCFCVSLTTLAKYWSWDINYMSA